MGGGNRFVVDRQTDVYSRTNPLRTVVMPLTRRQLLARLDELGIESVTVEHEPVFTVQQSAELRETLPGAHTKTLFLDDHVGHLVLVAAKDDTKVNLKALAKKLGMGRFSFGKAELLAELLGVTPGSVTPFALINDRCRHVTVVVDAALLQFDEVNFHPLENNATTRIATRDLIRLIRACGHKPHIVALD
jgi:Ala-tRNA(Pro) deacylase